MELKDALNDDIIITRLYLDKDFVNTQTTTAWVVKAPNGYTDTFRQTISPGCQHMLMWEACGCVPKKIIEKRKVNGCVVDGIQLKKVDSKILEYTTKGKASATKNYHLIIKPWLKDQGIFIVGHKCEVYEPSERDIDNENCHDKTLLEYSDLEE